MYESYTQSRKWLLTINNPQDHGMSHDEIIDRAQKFNPDYMCLADEIGEEGTYHTHLFLYSSSQKKYNHKGKPESKEKIQGIAQYLLYVSVCKR